MTKFLATKLIELRTAPVPEAAGEETGRKRRTVKLIIMGVLILVFAVVAVKSLVPRLFPGFNIERLARREAPPRIPERPPTSPEAGTPRPAVPPKPEETPLETGTSPAIDQMPWYSVIAPLVNSFHYSKGKLYSVTTGPEGVLMFSGVVPGENTNVDSGGSLLPGANIEFVKVLSVQPTSGGVRYVASAKLLPVSTIKTMPERIPPYLRGQTMRQLDSLAHASGLIEVESEPVGRDVVPGGSRFLIALRATGPLSLIEKYIRRVEDCGKMVEIGRFTLEGIEEKPIREGTLRVGFLFRIYDIETTADKERLAGTIASNNDTASR